MRNVIFKDKVVWITGASSGIGKELALQLARAGAELILSARNESALHKLSDECKRIGVKSEVVLMDLSNSENVIEATQKVINNYKHIHYVFHNAGQSQRSFVYETRMDIDRTIMEVNYFGSVQITKLILPTFMKQGFGHFVITSSIVGVFGFPLRSAYSAAKHALHGYYESLRAELHEKNIHVTIVCPGRIKTEISVHALDANGEPTHKMDETLKSGMPVDRCVSKMLVAVAKRKKEVFIGNSEIFMIYFKKFIPPLFYKLVTKVRTD